MIPLLLGRFQPTQVLEAIPALLTIALIMVATALLVRVSHAWFRAVGHGRVRLPGSIRSGPPPPLASWRWDWSTAACCRLSL